MVHENHGLGIYRGIEKVEVDKVMKDYIKIEYAKGGNLYIPATQLEMIQKYAGSDAKKPKLNRLGGSEWDQNQVKSPGSGPGGGEGSGEALRGPAGKGRLTCTGRIRSGRREFEELFPFEETEDQQAGHRGCQAGHGEHEDHGSADLRRRGLRKDRDRYPGRIQGSPGEQAGGLSGAHYHSGPAALQYLCPADEGLSGADRSHVPVSDSGGDQKDRDGSEERTWWTLSSEPTGVLSSDVEFKDLGLLIIDEEQRFGVAHKEKIKKLKENVDVLTLTATPIPRTLHMSLIGIRDMSVLEEAPQDRLPIQTYVMEYDERDGPGGHLAGSWPGAARSITSITGSITLRRWPAQVAALVPEANVAYAHGQMREHELERIMFGLHFTGKSTCWCPPPSSRRAWTSPTPIP